MLDAPGPSSWNMGNMANLPPLHLMYLQLSKHACGNVYLVMKIKNKLKNASLKLLSRRVLAFIKKKSEVVITGLSF